MENDLEAYVEKRCLSMSVRFAHHKRQCRKCGGNLSSAVDILTLNSKQFLRYLIFCYRDECNFWIALFEHIPSDYRTFDTKPWPPPLSDPPLAS